MKKVIIFICILLLCFFSFKILSYKVKKPVINSDLLHYSSSRYMLSAKTIENYGKNPIYYPPVSVYPESNKFSFLLIYEKYQLSTKQQSRLFFSAKRINELLTWGNQLPVQGNVHSLVDLQNIRLTWNKKPSFESELALYTQLINQEIASTQSIQVPSIRDSQYSEIKRYIFQNQKDLENSIKNYQIDENKKIYLLRLTNILFNYYNDKLGINNNASSNIVTYPLTELMNNNDFGTYNILLDSNDFKNVSTDSSLTINDKKYIILSDSHQEQLSFLSPINPKTQSISLQAGEGELRHLLWSTSEKEATDDSSQNEIIYTSDISSFIPFDSVSLSFTNVPKNLIFSMDITSNTKDSNIIKFDTTINATQLESIIIVKKNFNEKISFSLISNKDIPLAELDNIGVTKKLIEVPPIILEKKDALILPQLLLNQENNQLVIHANSLTLEQKNNLLSQLSGDFSLISTEQRKEGQVTLVFQSKEMQSYKDLLCITLAILFIVSIFTKKIRTNTRKGYKKLCNYLKRNNKSIKIDLPYKAKRIVVIVLFFMITIDVFLLPYIFDPLNFLLIFISVISLRTKKNHRSLYIFAMITMSYAFIAYFTKQQIWLEKASSWTYELILIGVVLDLISAYFYEKE